MIWTCLRCSFTLLLSFVVLVSTDNDSNNPDPLLLNADPSLIFLSELPLVRVRLFGQNIGAQNVGNIHLYNPKCSCHIQVTVLNFSRNEANISLSPTAATGVYQFVITTSSSNMTSNVSIEVLPDPLVIAVTPKLVFSMGGIRLTIHGSGFDRSGEARIEVTNATTTVPSESVTSQVCVSRTDTKMVCILPKLSEDAFILKDPFHRQITGVNLLFKKKILPLPIDQSFNFTTQRPDFASPSGLFVYNPNKHSLLDISGSKILAGCSVEDYVVRLGSYECPIAEATDDLITFAPPKSKPKSSADLDARFNCGQHNGALPLLVQLGDPKNSSSTFFVRCLTYEGSNELAFQLGLGLGVGLFLLLVLLAAVGMLIFLCLRYSKQKMKDLAWEHNVKVVREFNEKKQKMENLACIPAILQMTSTIQENNETSPFGILGKIGSTNANLENKTDVVAPQQQHKVTTMTEVFRSNAQDATSQDDFVEAQPSTSYEEMSNSEMNSHEEVSQNLLFPDSVAGKADVGRNFLHKQVDE